MLEEDECRAFCDGEFDHGKWYPDFITSIGNHFTFNLYCKANCTRTLSRIRAENYDSVVGAHLEYLQLAYYKTDNIEAACHAIGGFMLFEPDNEAMKHNVEFYKDTHAVSDAWFKPKNVS